MNYLHRTIMAVVVYVSAACMGLGAMSGDGSSGSPWQVANVTNLQEIGTGGYALDHYYVLANNIDASATTNWNSGAGFDPIVDFAGSFDGQSNSISNLYINRDTENNVGLFANVASGSVVQDLRLVDVDVYGNQYTGGLVGLHQGGSIARCSVSGLVRGKAGSLAHGGLVGASTGASCSITKCYASATVLGSARVGGLCGDPKSSASISDCFAIGTVMGGSEVGGLVGWIEASATLNRCYATGRTAAGGLIGKSTTSGAINDCFWDTDSSMQATSAGGTGLTSAEMVRSSNFTNWDFDTVWVNVDGQTYPWLRAFGAQVVPAGGDGTSIYPWEVTTLTDLQKVGSGTDGWDLDSYYALVNNIDASATTNWNSGAGFDPIGQASPYFTGTFDGRGYTISGLTINRNGIDNIGLFAVGERGSVIKDFVLQDMNLTATGASNVGGLVANILLSNPATIMEDVRIQNIRIVSDCRCAGLSAHSYYGTATRCSVSGSVDGGSATYVGGLIGRNYGRVEECFSTASVSGGERTGGLVGDSYLSAACITNCYATGDVTGSRYVGGLIGSSASGAQVYSSYATGEVTGSPSGGLVGWGFSAFVVEDSFWDTNTTGMATSVGGTGKTTAEMKSLSTYTTVATGLGDPWDIVADYSDTSVWGILPSINSGYPFLQEFETRPLQGTMIMMF